MINSARDARLKLAVLDAFDCRDGDPDEFSDRCAQVVDLHERLVAEQRAELGYMPTTFGGCIAVLNVAAAVLELLGGDDDLA